MQKRPDFESLLVETEDMIFSLGMRLFRKNEEDALDFAQDVYLQAFKKYSSYRGESKPSTWLYSLALNLGLSKIKKEKRLKKISAAELEEQGKLIANLPAAQSDEPDALVLALLEKKELSEEIEKALEELPEHYRLPLILHFFENLSYEKISQKTGMPEGSIKSNVYRAKLLLRNALKKTAAGIL